MSTFELTPEQKIRQRYAWFQEAQRLGNVQMACLRLGISRKTFYKWKHRFHQAKEQRSALRRNARDFCCRGTREGGAFEDAYPASRSRFF